jgi:hypothetical protein
MSARSNPQTAEAVPADAQAALLQLTNGYWATQIVYVAAKLGIADLLAHGPQRLEALAEATRTHAPSLQRLMRALGGLGVFRETDSGEIRGHCYRTLPREPKPWRASGQGDPQR